jgi:hypothetical protein
VLTGRNIRVFADAEDRSEQIGRALLAAPTLTGSTLVAAWEPRRLPRLAQGLGWPLMPSIGDDEFDGLWLLRYSIPVLLVSLQLASCPRPSCATAPV